MEEMEVQEDESGKSHQTAEGWSRMAVVAAAVQEASAAALGLAQAAEAWLELDSSTAVVH